jgi:hypothetical protein
MSRCVIRQSRGSALTASLALEKAKIALRRTTIFVSHFNPITPVQPISQKY